MEEEFYGLDVDRRIALVRREMEEGRPLMIRWAEIAPDFGDRWQPRATTAAQWLAAAKAIVDLGCGTMTLEGHLRPEQRYIPVDLARRDERTVVIDLNQAADLGRLPAADACALLGVLEYIYRPHDLIAALHGAYSQVVASFNLRGDEESADERLRHGWVNHYSRSELLSLFADHGYAPSRFHLVENRRQEFLFDLQRI